MSRFLKGLGQMTSAGFDTIANTVGATIKIGVTGVKGTVKVVDKVLEGEFGEAAQTGWQTATETSQIAGGAIKNGFIGTVETVHGGVSALRGVRQDFNELGRGVCRAAAGETGEKIFDIVSISASADKDEPDDKDA